jgi:membrane-associated phospholipid phosphatase
MAVIGLQTVFQRSGPPVKADDWTYPSGHAVFVVAFALTAVLISRSAKVLALISGLVVLVSASRLVLGEHYLVDVVAGIAATTGIGLLAAAALRIPVIGRTPYPAAGRRPGR